MGLPLQITNGQVLNYDYTGGVQSIMLPPGSYKLECWGAQGGYRSSATYGGKGGYSVGELTLNEETMLYVQVGRSGGYAGDSIYTTETSGGYNGGGKRDSGSPGGGGATDIRIGQDSLYARVIVAGGGGSDGANNKKGMYGGGESGGSSTENYGTGGFGGTQTGVSDSSWQTTSQSTGTGTATDAYAGFGFGGNGVTYSSGYGGAGGGGWYGGSGAYPDSSGDDDRGGGGGSGYIYTSSTASNYPSGCLLNSSYYLTNAQTIAGNASFPSPTSGSTETGHSGNGYARITVLSIKSPISAPVRVDGQWHDCNEIFVKVNGVWKACANAYVKVGGAWKECIENTISNVTTYELSKFGSYVNTVKVNGTAVTLPIQVAAGTTIEVTSTGYDASAYSMIWSGPTPTSNHTVSSGSTTARIVTFIMPSEDIIIRFNRQTVSSGTTYTISKGNNVASIFINNGNSITTSTNAKPGDTITIHSDSFSTSTVSAITWAGTGVPTANISYNNYVTKGSTRYRKVTFTMPANNVTTAFRKTSSGGSTDM